MSLVVINDVEIIQLISHGEPVVTIDMVADVHGVTVSTARNGYDRHREKFEEGIDTWVVEGDELQQLGRLSLRETPNERLVRSVRVFNERGYLKLTKPMRDDVSWEVFGRMLDAYFRVQALDAAAPYPYVNGFRTATEHAAAELEAHLAVCAMLDMPRPAQLIESVKHVRFAVGVDYTPLLAQSTSMDHIADEGVFLEPTSLGALFGISGAEMNRTLAAHGLQTRADDKSWVPTDDVINAGHVFRHLWAKGTKSGYNVKWNVAFIRNVLSVPA